MVRRLAMIVVCAVGASASAFADPPPAAPPPAAPAVDLRKTDWCNFSYANSMVYPMLIDCTATVDVRHSSHGGIYAFRELRFVRAAYGDLTADGVEDALLAIEVTERPVLIQAAPPRSTAELWLMQARPDGMSIYTSESADTVPSSVTIAKGVATLVWTTGKTRCSETWTFGKEGESATKSARRCTSP